MDILFDFIGKAWDFIYSAWYIVIFVALFVIMPISALWEKNKKLAIGVVSLVLILGIIFVPKYYASKQTDMYVQDLVEIVVRTNIYGVEFDDAYLRFEDSKMSSEQLIKLIDKFIVTFELCINEIRELKTPDEFEKFSALQVQLDLKAIEMYKKISKEISIYDFIDFENYHEEYADIEQIGNEINIELVRLQKDGLMPSE
jgi:hypothetical protein